METPALPPRVSLKAFLVVMVLWGLIIFVAAVYGRRLERHNIHLVTHELNLEQDREEPPPAHISRVERLKNQGISLTRMALLQPDLVSLFGSSELRKPIPDKAGIFFNHYPTGFAVYQVGKAGATSIILLQKIAAAAPSTGPRHVAISLSPSWFDRTIDPHYYSGNFSREQATSVLFDRRLSLPLKEAIAARMRDFPRTMEAGSLLTYSVARLTGGTAWNRLVYYLMYPLGWLQNLVYAAQDHFETALYIVTGKRGWDAEVPRQTEALNWPQLIADAQKQSPDLIPDVGIVRKNSFPSDALFIESMNLSPEWGDLELLLRTFQELHIQPLILSIPPEGTYLESMGMTKTGVAEYSKRLHALCEKYGAVLQAFDDHSYDLSFLKDHHDHLSIKGWIYYNRAIDDYFHRKGPR